MRQCRGREQLTAYIGALLMSALGQKRSRRQVFVMSVLPPKADISEDFCHVR